MNNYYNYQDYMRQVKQNKGYITMQNSVHPNHIPPTQPLPNHTPIPDSEKTYDPYQGFIRGNLFSYLYDPYKMKLPYEINPMNEQADILTHIDSLGFAMIDLNLYLDIHPEDKKMIDLYNKCRIKKNAIMQQYQSEFGPLLTNSDALNSYPWAWNQTPEPWENR